MNEVIEYGKGFDKRSLYRFVQSYQQYPEIAGAVSPQSGLVDTTKIVGGLQPHNLK